MPDYVVIARVGSPFGLKGWSHVYSLLDVPKDLLRYGSGHLGKKKPEFQLEIAQIKPHAGHFVVQFKGCEDRTHAMALTQLYLFTLRETLPELPETEYYWVDLVGLSVENQLKEPLGVVKEVFSTGSNDVLVIQDNQKQRLIPFLWDRYVLDVDIGKKRIQVDWDKSWD
jgi:16S rRNA processing protein RimM